MSTNTCTIIPLPKSTNSNCEHNAAYPFDGGVTRLLKQYCAYVSCALLSTTVTDIATFAKVDNYKLRIWGCCIFLAEDRIK